MSKITLICASCVDQNVDAVVNAANRNLQEGDGVCGAIFEKAGALELEKACCGFATPLPDGSAVVTPAFGISNTEYIIHAVGPDFGETPDAFDKLFDAYYHSLLLLRKLDKHSISFPLISAGIYAGDLENPVAESVKQCCLAYKKFTENFPDYFVDLKLCVYTASKMSEAKLIFDRMTRKDFDIENKDRYQYCCRKR